MNAAELEAQPLVAAESEMLIDIPSGLLGFERIKRFILSRNPDEEPFQWFKAQGSSLSFLVVSPFEVISDYRPDLPAEDVQYLGLETPHDALLLNIVTLRPGSRATVNLKGPIVINRFSQVGKQVVLANASDYSVQHPLTTEQV